VFLVLLLWISIFSSNFHYYSIFHDFLFVRPSLHQLADNLLLPVLREHATALRVNREYLGRMVEGLVFVSHRQIGPGHKHYCPRDEVRDLPSFHLLNNVGGHGETRDFCVFPPRCFSSHDLHLGRGRGVQGQTGTNGWDADQNASIWSGQDAEIIKTKFSTWETKVIAPCVLKLYLRLWM
jgi:hypothetical protein